MMTLAINKQSMKYSLQVEREPIYETDENGNIVYDHYTDSDGNIIYYLDENGEKIPLTTGEYITGYLQPVSFFGNIAMSGGEVDSVEFGIDVSGYDATLVVDKGTIPIDETSLIWHTSEVGYKDAEKTIVDGSTADYKVIAVKPSLNTIKYILGRITK